MSVICDKHIDNVQIMCGVGYSLLQPIREFGEGRKPTGLVTSVHKFENISRSIFVKPRLHVKLEGAREGAYLRQVNFY